MAEKNPILEANLKAMEYIWSQCPKEEKDGVEFVTYLKTDIPFLYYSGLVDTERHSLEEWQKAFEDCPEENDRYWVSHEKMLSLAKYRYYRSVNLPFDPLLMRVGKYDIDRLWKVYEKSVIPSTSLPKEFMKNKFDQIFRKQKSVQKAFKGEIEKAEEEGEDVDSSKIIELNFESEGGKEYVNVEKQHLINLKNLLDTYPSPRRKLELAVYEMRMNQLQELSDIATKPQQSKYESGPDFRKTTQTSLKDMLVKASDKKSGGRKPTDEVLDLKALQKKNRPTKF